VRPSWFDRLTMRTLALTLSRRRRRRVERARVRSGRGSFLNAIHETVLTLSALAERVCRRAHDADAKGEKITTDVVVLTTPSVV